jgi:hypothetical protein
MITKFQELLNVLDTNGGHIFLMLVLMLIGVGSYTLGKVDLGKEITTGAFGDLLYSLKAGAKTP